VKAANWLIPLGAAASLGVLVWLVPAHNIFARLYQPRVTRQEAIVAAGKLAREYGVDTSTWTWAVTTGTDGGQREAIAAFPNSPVLRSLNPFSLRALATARSGEMVLVQLGPSGRPIGYQHRKTAAPHPGAASAAPAPELLQRELNRYAGPNSAAFTPTTTAVASQEGLRTVWEWVDPDTPGILAHFELVTRQGSILRTAYTTEIAFRLMAGHRRPQQLITGAAIGSVIAIGSLIAFLGIWNFFSRMTTRMDHIRFGLPFCVVAAAPILANWLSGGVANQAAFAPLDLGSSPSTVLLGSFTGSVLIMLGIALLLASGYALLPDQAKPRWIALRLISQRNLFARQVGRELVLGLLGGIAICGLFFLPAAAPGLVREYARVSAPSFLVDPVPAVTPLGGLISGADFLALFCFLLPWLQARSWPRWIGVTAFAVLGALAIAAIRQPFPRDVAANLIASALALAALTAIYHATGVLAIWFAAVGMMAALQASTQFVCGTAAFTAQATHTTVLWSLFLLTATLIWRFGVQADEQAVIESMQPSGKSISRSDRDRLLAEFTVARRAQEGMLPLEPPTIPAYSVAAACEPAREVGGDLYDFLAFPGGEWGICVADVSGKGVPAALYMTLTKGMLVSAASRPADLPLIASRMNRFLAEAGRRRTFVTMSLGVLDAATGVFQHIRAGHNPPLLYTSRNRECRYLMPKGIGLGITASSAFERNLEVEEIRLVPGDVLVLYSDGLTECMNSTRQLYGEDRLCDVLRRNAHLNALGIQDAILTGARAFRGAAEPHDDLTVVVLRAEARDSLG
jgi:hypothetical protein